MDRVSLGVLPFSVEKCWKTKNACFMNHGPYSTSERWRASYNIKNEDSESDSWKLEDQIVEIV